MSDDIWQRDEPDSPCQKICVMHPEAGLCIGCLRTRDEIARWRQMTPAERRRVTETLSGRKDRIPRKRGGRKARLSPKIP